MKHYILMLYASLFEFYRFLAMKSPITMKLLYLPGINGMRNFNSTAKAYAEFYKASKRVPGYKKFLEHKNFTKMKFKGLVPDLQQIPSTDKENYVKTFSMEDRCVYGKIPDKEVIIDESSGSSGTATNWARGKHERKKNAKVIEFSIKHLLGDNPIFVINAFALGPWATGVNVTIGCVKFAKIKSLGPDKIKIENTLKHFGNKHNYVIMGYPPFLKIMIDNSSIDWKSYNVTLIFGGESMSEGMRDYLLSKGIKKIYSSLGASDLELNLAAENDFTISLRRLIRKNQTLRERVTKHIGAIPMIFQFNPSDFLFESNGEGELVVTVCRSGYIAPKIRYNLHDTGHVMNMKELMLILKDLNISTNELVLPKTDLPLLFHYGRSDMTVSFFGSNISPVDVQEVLYLLSDYRGMFNSYHLDAVEDKDGNKKLLISLEVCETTNIDSIDQEKLVIAFYEQLAIVNQDFREAKKMLTSDKQLLIQLLKSGEGVFRQNDIRIKAKYI